MSRPPLARDTLVRHICGLGNDKNGNPINIRTAELAAACAIAPGSIQAMLAGPVARGEIYVCKVTPPSGRAFNEYRQGGGQPAPEFKPLDTKRAGVALSTAHQAPRPTLSKPPQPEVGKSTPAAGASHPPRGEPAVAAKATPRPDAHAALKEEPAVREVSAGDVFSITLDDAGVLIIAADDGVIELQPNHAKRLGHFMVGSERIWNPF